MKRIIMTILVLTFYFGCDNITESDYSIVTACFSHLTGGDLQSGYYVTFHNCSENANSYLWDFGDSTQSIEKDPIHIYDTDGAYTVSLIASNESNLDTSIKTILVDWNMVEKPNIYLYPVTDIDLSLYLEFSIGGRVVKSIPEYGDGWQIHVQIGGKIDNQYNFLFYEAIQPDVWQQNQGWCIVKESVAEFFQANMQTYNFAANEIADFIDYWTPKLVDYDYYTIYPQNDQVIEQVISLNFSEQPDNINRLFYVVGGAMEFKAIEAPLITAFTRTGFTVIEWGVIRK